MKQLVNILSKNKVYGISSSNKLLCENYIKGKLHKTSIRNSKSHSSDLLEIVYSDACIMTKYSVSGNSYFIIFTNDKYQFVYTMVM